MHPFFSHLFPASPLLFFPSFTFCYGFPLQLLRGCRFRAPPLHFQACRTMLIPSIQPTENSFFIPNMAVTTPPSCFFFLLPLQLGLFRKPLGVGVRFSPPPAETCHPRGVGVGFLRQLLHRFLLLLAFSFSPDSPPPPLLITPHESRSLSVFFRSLLRTD